MHISPTMSLTCTKTLISHIHDVIQRFRVVCPWAASPEEKCMKVDRIYNRKQHICELQNYHHMKPQGRVRLVRLYCLV